MKELVFFCDGRALRRGSVVHALWVLIAQPARALGAARWHLLRSLSGSSNDMYYLAKLSRHLHPLGHVGDRY
jgi:hypothetical protein